MDRLLKTVDGRDVNDVLGLLDRMPDEEAVTILVQAIVTLVGIDDDLLAEASDLLADGGV